MIVKALVLSVLTRCKPLRYGVIGILVGIVVGTQVMPINNAVTAVTMTQAVPRDFNASSKPLKAFEANYAAYSTEDKKRVRDQIDLALSALQTPITEIDKVAALAYHVYNHIERASVSARGAADVWRAGKAVCGGMAVTLAEMLYAEGIKASLAYTRGGTVAHSMTEAHFADGTSMLLDPYHGVVYYDQALKKPVGINTLPDYIAKGKAPVWFARLSKEPYASFNTAFAVTDNNQRSDYAFPELFKNADAMGLADSGNVDTVHITLTPETTLGDAAWNPTDAFPKPWSALSQIQRDGRYLSWAYILGDIAQGYRVQHAYRLQGLVPDAHYQLQLQVANAYVALTSKAEQPVVTIEQIYPPAEIQTMGTRRFMLEVKGYANDNLFEPQHITLPFAATSSEMTFLADATGDVVLASIRLKKE